MPDSEARTRALVQLTLAPEPVASAVDLLCGPGGPPRGLTEAGVKVVGGIELGPDCA